jgi:hypothetical protein
MRLDIPEVKNIYTKVMQKCECYPGCKYPRVTGDFLYGSLSVDVHLLPDIVFVRDDDPPDFAPFFTCLAEMYGVKTEVLNSNMIEVSEGD